MAQTHDYEIMRRYNHRRLTAGARHVVGISRSGVLTKTIDPKEAAVDGALVRYPGRCRRADELGLAFGQDAFALPDTVLKIKIAEPRPVAAGTDFVTLPQKIAERIRFDPHGADADFVEQRCLWER